MESLIEKIIPSDIADNTKYFEQTMPYHLQPPSFSRTDISTDYNYKPDQIQHRPSYPPVVADTLESNLIGRNRARRPHNAYIVNYDKSNIPNEPLPNALKVADRYKNMDDKLAELKKVILLLATVFKIIIPGGTISNLFLVEIGHRYVY